MTASRDSSLDQYRTQARDLLKQARAADSEARALLREAGGQDEMSRPDVLTAPLLNAAPATAAELIRRGAAMDIRHAAALGQLDYLAAQLEAGTDTHQREEALAFACVRGQEGAARLLVRHGATGDVLVAPGGQTPRTALHEASNRGHRGIVTLMLDVGADASVVEPHFGGTAADWAREGGHYEIAALLVSQIPGAEPGGRGRTDSPAQR